MPAFESSGLQSSPPGSSFAHTSCKAGARGWVLSSPPPGPPPPVCLPAESGHPQPTACPAGLLSLLDTGLLLLLDSLSAGDAAAACQGLLWLQTLRPEPSACLSLCANREAAGGGGPAWQGWRFSKVSAEWSRRFAAKDDGKVGSRGQPLRVPGTGQHLFLPLPLLQCWISPCTWRSDEEIHAQSFVELGTPGWGGVTVATAKVFCRPALSVMLQS